MPLLFYKILLPLSFSGALIASVAFGSHTDEFFGQNLQGKVGASLTGEGTDCPCDHNRAGQSDTEVNSRDNPQKIVARAQALAEGKADPAPPASHGESIR